MNFFLAAILLSIGFMIGLPSIIDRTLPATAHVSERHLSVMRVLPDSPAEKAGITEGDVIVTIDGRVMEKEDDVRTYLADHGTKGIDLAIEKVDKTIRAVHVTAEPLVGAQITGIGVAFVQTGRVSYPFYLAVPEGVRATIQMTGQIFSSFFGLLKSFVQGHGAGANLSGPVGIAAMTGQVASMGFVYILQFAALLSINLGVVNILPFPALDGGRIFFLLIEKIRGKTLNERLEIFAHNFGFMLLMALIVFVTVKDVMHLFK